MGKDDPGEQAPPHARGGGQARVAQTSVTSWLAPVACCIISVCLFFEWLFFPGLIFLELGNRAVQGVLRLNLSKLRHISKDYRCGQNLYQDITTF